MSNSNYLIIYFYLEEYKKKNYIHSIYNMPAVVRMTISNNNNNSTNFGSIVASRRPDVIATPATPSRPAPRGGLASSSMIQRIHTIRPGCGSCGRH